MLSRHVRRVATRILAASNLGVIRGDTLSPYSQAGQDGASWNPDEEFDKAAASSAREWDVIVINDPKMVNAQVVPGESVMYPFGNASADFECRAYYGVHGNIASV
jgi:hypothetical protein